MKKILFFALLALIPLYLQADNYRSDNVYGYWEDYYSGIALTIKPAKRKGILVKRLDRSRRSNWIRYDRIGRNLYDDCNGNRIRLTRNGIKWTRKHGRRVVYLEKSGFGQYGYDRGFRDRGYEYDYDPGYRRNYIRPSSLSGNWFCDSFGVGIEINTRRDGIRVRRTDRRGNDAWYYYNQEQRNPNRYLGVNNSYYELQGNTLVFNDYKNNKTLRFKRR